MAKTPTQLLKAEHASVLQKLDALEEIFSRLDKKEEVSASLKELAAFFDTDFWTHFAKEEEALFPEMETFIPRNAGPIGVMLMEHEDLRKTNTELQRLVPVYLNGSQNSEMKQQIQKYGNYFVGVLRDHIHKEDNILFMMADMHLDKAQIEKVLGLFQKIEAARGAKVA